MSNVPTLNFFVTDGAIVAPRDKTGEQRMVKRRGKWIWEEGDVKHENLEPGNVLEFWGAPWTPQNVWNLETSGLSVQHFPHSFTAHTAWEEKRFSCGPRKHSAPVRYRYQTRVTHVTVKRHVANGYDLPLSPSLNTVDKGRKINR